MIRSRRLRSLFYAATSSPFRLRIYVPYSTEHDLSKSLNEKVISISNSIKNLNQKTFYHIVASLMLTRPIENCVG